MNKQALAESLTQLGLSPAEIIIYIHLLKSEPKTPLELSRELNINRSKMYRLLEDLIQKKLLEEHGLNRGFKVKAASVQNLELLVSSEEEKAKTMREFLPDLISSLSSFSSFIRDSFEILHYRGTDGLKQMLWNELRSKEVLIFGNSTINDFVGKKFGDKHRREAVIRNIQYREIGNELRFKSKDQSFYNSAKNWEKVYQYKQISEKILKIRHSVETYNDTVSIINWKNGKEAGIEIINKPLAQMQRQIFWKFWNIAK